MKTHPTAALAEEAPKEFLSACRAADIPPTKRQLSKWFRHTGTAREEHNKKQEEKKKA